MNDNFLLDIFKDMNECYAALYSVDNFISKKAQSFICICILHFAIFGDLPWHTVCQRILRFSSWCYCNPFEEWLEINNVTYKTLSRSEKKSEKYTLSGIV